MDFSKLDRNRFILGAGSGLLLMISILFLPWYSLELNPQRVLGETGGADTFICGADKLSCTGFETFTINRWLLLLAALAPLILGWIIVRGHKLSWAPGEVTMIAGMSAFVLIGYNGFVDKPGTGIAEVGVSLDWGYWVALLAAAGIAATGFLRSQAGQKRERKAPGTV
jgi:hypothetical protein